MPADRSKGVANAHKTVKPSSKSAATSKKPAATKAVSSPVPASKGAPLDENSSVWNEGAKRARKARGGKAMVHNDRATKVDEILLAFDNNYGPCLGMTRLERWERAEALGLEPPSDVKEILLTGPGQTKKRLCTSVYSNRHI